jgi:cytochrome b6-f complex iron-sulfur subunit
MSSLAIIAVALVALLALGAIVVLTTAKRAEFKRATGHLSRESRAKDAGSVSLDELTPQTSQELERSVALARTGGGALAERGPTELIAWVPRDADQVQMDRRHFMNVGMIIMMLFGISAFATALIAFLWPSSKGGFGSKFTVGTKEDVDNGIKAGRGFFYVPEGRAWVTAYPAESVPKAEAIYKPVVVKGMQAGYTALYQRCVHLGCRVPNCGTSQWFECPCHGSQYNRNGEKKGGPAPRGLDHFAIAVENGKVTLDTSTIITGPPIGTNTTGQEAEGPHCVSGGGAH